MALMVFKVHQGEITYGITPWDKFIYVGKMSDMTYREYTTTDDTIQIYII